uniref:Uncharacterized protein n=1 Tax=Lepeophtheirus salmonis TaxID=72036 RepID=A0A0K2TQH5_LEPSM
MEVRHSIILKTISTSPKTTERIFKHLS